MEYKRKKGGRKKGEMEQFKVTMEYKRKKKLWDEKRGEMEQFKVKKLILLAVGPISAQ